MNALKMLFLLPLSMLCLKTSAQIDDLLKNKNITWIAETYNDFLTERAHGDIIGKEISRVTQLKFLNKTEGTIEDTYVFQSILLNQVKEGKILIYKDEELKTRMSYTDIYHFDTINRTPEDGTIREILQILEPDPESILFFRVRQVVYYNSKTAQFGLRTLAVAPMNRVVNNKDTFNHAADFGFGVPIKKVMNDTGEVIAWKPLFWMKATDLTKKRKLEEDDITWAARMALHSGTKLIGEDSVKILKSIGLNKPVDHLFNVFEQNPKVPFYRVEEFNSKVLYPFEDRLRLLTNIDTIMTVDPKTYETKMKVAQSKIESKDIKRLRLVQNWYWNDKKKRLEIYLVATAPMKDVTNEAGEFLYSVPVFYRRTDD